MANAADLTTLDALAPFISPDLKGPSLTTAAPILSKIISAVSIGIDRYLSRKLMYQQLSEVRNGNGVSSMRTLRYPICDVMSVVIAPLAGAPGRTLLPTNGNQVPSITWDKWFIYLNPGYFTSIFERGRQNVTLNYSAGFLTPGMVAVQQLPQWPGNNQQVAHGAQIQVNGYYFICRVPGTTLAAGMPPFPTPAGGVSPTLPGYVWPSPVTPQPDGDTTDFTLPGTPSPAQATQVYLGGQLMEYGVDFSVQDNQLLMKVAPPKNTVLLSGFPTAGNGAVMPTSNGPIMNTVVQDGSVLWSCEGLVPIIPAGVDWLPDDIELSCLEQCALLYKNRTRVGDTGTGMGPDRVNYFMKSAKPETLDRLKPHREVFPIEGMGIQ